MKKTISVLIIFLLILSLSISISKADLSKDIESINEQYKNQNVPSGLNKLFGNERINIYIDDKKGREIVLNIETKKGKITNIGIGKLDNPSLNMYGREKLINEIKSSGDVFNSIQNAIKRKELTYKAVGFKNKIKFGAAFFLVKIYNIFKPSEIKYTNLMNCNDIILHVDSESNSENQTGNADAPFSTITRALDYAENRGCFSATINLDIGKYHNENIIINRDTNIAAYNLEIMSSDEIPMLGVEIINSSITSSGSYKLKIDGVNIDRGNGIRIDGENAETILNNVVISNAFGHGVEQTGGLIKMNRVTISSTKIGSDEIDEDSGAGILLKGGVKAVLNNVNIESNEGGALRISDKGTSVYANQFFVQSNDADENKIKRNISNYIGTGTVEVRNDGLLLVKDGSFTNNKYVGLLVLDGGKAHIKDSAISHTQHISEIINNRFFGGANIFVKQNSAVDRDIAELELTNVVSSNAQFIGLQVMDSFIKAKKTNITRNAIGINIASPNGIINPDINCIVDEVFVFDNGNDFQRDEMSLPDVNELINVDGRQIERNNVLCADVPFECSWCD